MKGEKKGKKVKREKTNRDIAVVPRSDKVNRVFQEEKSKHNCKTTFDTREYSITPQG